MLIRGSDDGAMADVKRGYGCYGMSSSVIFVVSRDSDTSNSVLCRSRVKSS